MTRDDAAPLPLFGKRLRRTRRAMGVKQLALAQIMNVDQATVSRWEAGRQAPHPDLQRQALQALVSARTEDAALKRLVESSVAPVHLIDDATHICLAYSSARARDWGASRSELQGVSLWRFATDEIREAERALGASDWWTDAMPAPKRFRTSGADYDKIRITPGPMMWERLYLSDGTPVRLVTGLR